MKDWPKIATPRDAFLILAATAQRAVSALGGDDQPDGAGGGGRGEPPVRAVPAAVGGREATPAAAGTVRAPRRPRLPDVRRIRRRTDVAGTGRSHVLRRTLSTSSCSRRKAPWRTRPKAAPRPTATTFEIPDDVNEIAEDLKEMRATMLAGGSVGGSARAAHDDVARATHDMEPEPLTTTVEASCCGAVGDVPQAVATREASVRTTRVSWRRDIERLRIGDFWGWGTSSPNVGSRCIA